MTPRSLLSVLVVQHLATPTATEACLDCWRIVDPTTAHPCDPADRMEIDRATTRQTVMLLRTL